MVAIGITVEIGKRKAAAKPNPIAIVIPIVIPGKMSRIKKYMVVGKTPVPRIQPLCSPDPGVTDCLPMLQPEIGLPTAH